MTGLTYCGETVRKYDPDRFLLSLFMPASAREALWALYAFNHEIAKTREVVTETQLGLIRLQWWRDALGAVYEGGTVLQHQVVEPLAQAIRVHNLPRELFDNLIYAREFDLEDRLPSNMEGMTHYADFTATPLLKLAALVSGGSAEEEVRHTAIAYALTGILRATPHHLSQRRCYLPENLIPSVQALYDGKQIAELKGAVKAVAENARHHLKLARKEAGGRWIRLHAALAHMYLSQIAAADYNVFSARLQAPPPLRLLRLGWVGLRS